MRVSNDLLFNAETAALSATSQAVSMEHMALADLTAVIAGANQSNKTFASAAVDVSANTVTTAAHGYLTGTKVTLTTDDVLPGGLAVLTDYYLIVVSATVLKFATSQANALAGTAIDITDAGTGNHTVVVTTALAGSVKLQKCNDPESVPDAAKTWVDITSSSQNFAAAATLNWALVDMGYRSLRAVAAVTSGTVALSLRFQAKGA